MHITLVPCKICFRVTLRQVDAEGIRAIVSRTRYRIAILSHRLALICGSSWMGRRSQWPMPIYSDIRAQTVARTIFRFADGRTQSAGHSPAVKRDRDCSILPRCHAEKPLRFDVEIDKRVSGLYRNWKFKSCLLRYTSANPCPSRCRRPEEKETMSLNADKLCRSESVLLSPAAECSFNCIATISREPRERHLQQTRTAADIRVFQIT